MLFVLILFIHFLPNVQVLKVTFEFLCYNKIRIITVAYHIGNHKK